MNAMISESEKSNSVIVIMAKVPRPGTVKTRLKPFLNDLQCVELAVCFLQDTVLKSLKITENIIVAFSPADDRKEIEKILPKNVNLIEQVGENLGERMQSAVEFAERNGFSPIIVVGTDSPSFPSDYLQNAINLIEKGKSKVVIGAAEDGGYYLIGFETSVDGIFEDVEWSSPKALDQTIKNARKIFGIEPLQVASWYDVDTPLELQILCQEFLEKRDFKTIAPKTANWLENNRTLFISNDQSFE